MEKAKVAADHPCEIQLEQGKKYAYCTCGLSENQPFCDGNHGNTSFRPIVFEAEETKSCWMCQCKHTGNAPFCDGTHNHLNADQESQD